MASTHDLGSWKCFSFAFIFSLDLHLSDVCDYGRGVTDKGVARIARGGFCKS